MGLVMKNTKMQRKRIIAGICNESTTKNLVRWIRYSSLASIISIMLIIKVKVKMKSKK
jgi:hypothetical protein